MAESITMPKLGFDMREGVLVRWVKTEGENINKGDVLAEIETDKATVEVESSASGVVRKLFASQGESVPVGAVIAIVGTAEENIEELPTDTTVEKPKQDGKAVINDIANTKPALQATVETVPTPEGPAKASPLARKIATDQHLNLKNIQGTGPGGRIVRRDVEAALSGVDLGKEAVPAVTEDVASKQSPTFANLLPLAPIKHQDVKVQTSKLRQAIGRRLVESKQNLPHFYVSHEYKMEAINGLRKQLNGMLPEGEKISVNDFIVKAVALALREYPNLNSTLSGTEIIQHGAINMGVAVTVTGGLLTVVVKDADQKPLRTISSEVKAMAARAREGKVKPEDIDGSTFSTSNLGMYDVENFTAIINPPEAAILAIGSAREIPVIEDGQVKIGSRMKCTISVDHRISDGAEAAQFMQALAKYLEEPLRLMM